MSILGEILAWSKTLDPWQQDAIARIYVERDLGAEDKDHVFALLRAAAGIPDPDNRIAMTVDHADIAAAQVPNRLVQLVSIKNLERVNALAQKQTLPIGPSGLTVIYGQNGAGKSGYSRVLKQACRARQPGKRILADARHAPDARPQPAKAAFDVLVDGKPAELAWTFGQASPEQLSELAIFDADCARAYLDSDKTPIERKAIIAGTRAEVREVNARVRARQVDAGLVSDIEGCEIEIIDREENRDVKRFAPGDRVVFTQNDRILGVVNGATGTIKRIAMRNSCPTLVVELDEVNERGGREVPIPASFARFDLAWASTNHRSQGRTFDAAYVLANPAMSDREWTYVAASRSRFATTMFVNASALGLVNPESHSGSGPKKRRGDAIEALAKRMKRSRAKGTTLDYEREPYADPAPTKLSTGVLGAFVGRMRAAALSKQWLAAR